MKEVEGDYITFKTCLSVYELSTVVLESIDSVIFLLCESWFLVSFFVHLLNVLMWPSTLQPMLGPCLAQVMLSAGLCVYICDLGQT